MQNESIEILKTEEEFNHAEQNGFIPGEEELAKDHAELLVNPKTINHHVNEIIDALNNGWLDPTEAFVGLKRLSEVANQATKVIQDRVEEILEGHKGPLKIMNAEISLRKGATRYKFDHIPEIVAYKEKIKILEDKSKAAREAIDRGDELYSGKSGEQIPPAEKVVSKSSIAVKLLDK